MSNADELPQGPFRTAGGTRLTLGTRLGMGGQGSVFRVSGKPDSALKIYHKSQLVGSQADELRGRLLSMLERSPVNPTRAFQHESLAWPTDVVLTASGLHVGFLMPLLDAATSVPLHQLVNPSDRRAPDKAGLGLPGWLGAFDEWNRLVRVAANISGATCSIHNAGHVIGDFNESNVLVTDRALVTIIDCDSMQIQGPRGQIHLCPVFKPEFTAPEARGSQREPASDLFALAVHIFMLLMEGRHPFTGVWKARGDKPARSALAARGLYSLGHGGKPGDLHLPPSAPPAKILPEEIRNMFDRAFVAGATTPSARPTAQEWNTVLGKLDKSLVNCPRSSSHHYSDHLSTCPWCEHEAQRRAKAQAKPSQTPTSRPVASQRSSTPSTTVLRTPYRSQPSLGSHTANTHTVGRPTQPIQNQQHIAIKFPTPPRTGFCRRAILALILSLFAAPAGLVLGFFTLKHLRGNYERGRRLAIAAIIIGALGSLNLVLQLLTGPGGAGGISKAVIASSTAVNGTYRADVTAVRANGLVLEVDVSAKGPADLRAPAGACLVNAENQVVEVKDTNLDRNRAGDYQGTLTFDTSGMNGPWSFNYGCAQDYTSVPIQ